MPKKNILNLGGHPLIAYSIAAADICRDIERVIVSTDSQEIADIAKCYGAEVPFLRPPELARDNSPGIDYIRHALDRLRDNEDCRPEHLVQLLPTTPLRDPHILSDAIKVIASDSNATSLRSAHELPEPPQKMMGIENGFLVGLFPDNPRPEYYNLPRQTFPPAYHPNGYVEIIKTDVIRKHEGMFGHKVLAYITAHAVEIDRIEEFEYLEYLIEKKGHPLHDYLQSNFPEYKKLKNGNK